MAYLKAEVAVTLGVHNLRSFVDCSLFQMGWFVVARFLLTSVLHGPFFVLITQKMAVASAGPYAGCCRLHLVTRCLQAGCQTNSVIAQKALCKWCRFDRKQLIGRRLLTEHCDNDVCQHPNDVLQQPTAHMWCKFRDRQRNDVNS